METETIQYQRKEQNGYIKINVDGLWLFEHKYIIEQYIKRKLTFNEKVHHINQIKTDNRISNLVIFPNQNEHIKFHLKLKQFNYSTKPMLRTINNLKLNMIHERKKNLCATQTIE